MGQSRVTAVVPAWHPAASRLPQRGDPALAWPGLLAELLPSAWIQEGEAVLAQKDPGPSAVSRWPGPGGWWGPEPRGAAPSPAWWVLEGTQRGYPTRQGDGAQGWGVV